MVAAPQGPLELRNVEALGVDVLSGSRAASSPPLLLSKNRQGRARRLYVWKGITLPPRMIGARGLCSMVGRWLHPWQRMRRVYHTESDGSIGRSLIWICKMYDWRRRHRKTPVVFGMSHVTLKLLASKPLFRLAGLAIRPYRRCYLGLLFSSVPFRVLPFSWQLSFPRAVCARNCNSAVSAPFITLPLVGISFRRVPT